MSYIQSRIECDNCKHAMNVAFGIVGMTRIARWPSKCPECGQAKFTKIADGWEYEPVAPPGAPVQPKESNR